MGTVRVRAVTVAIALLLVSAAVLVTPAHAHAFGYLGYRWPKVATTWPQYRPYVNYYSLPSDWQTVCYDSKTEWNNTGASKLFFYGSNVAAHTITRGMYSDKGWLALTSTHLDALGNIDDSDTKINLRYTWNILGLPAPWSYDLQSTVTHELGHWLRLEHSSDVWATMYPDQMIGFCWCRSINGDDIAGIRYVYGAK